MMRQLVLSVKRSRWRADDPESLKADDGFDAVRHRVLSRDNHTCQFCLFRSGKWMEVHHLDDDHHNNDPNNLVTACSWCHACHHIGLAGRNKEAVLVWLPELTQADLHRICRACYVAKASQGPFGVIADAVLARIRSREAPIVTSLGSSDPAMLGEALLHLPEAVYQQRADTLAGVRLFPLPRRIFGDQDRWPEIVAAWTSADGPFGGLPPATWEALIDGISERIATAA